MDDTESTEETTPTIVNKGPSMSVSPLSRHLISPNVCTTPCSSNRAYPHARLLTSADGLQMLEEKERKKQEQLEERERKKREREEKKRLKAEEMQRKAQEKERKAAERESDKKRLWKRKGETKHQV